MADKPNVNTGLLYGVIADAMPMEGRDFAIETSLDGNNKPKLSITPLTDVGKAFVPLLLARLSKPMADAGVVLAGDGPVAQEVVTIRSLQRKIENESDFAREAKLKEAEAAQQAKMTAAKKIHDERVAKSGNDAPPSQEERKAIQEAQDATIQAQKLKRMSKKIPEIRNAINELAKKAATSDAQHGRSWAVDMDAPLSSLFDRQDVTAKFTAKEWLIDKLAEHAVEQDNLREQAVETAKQYIIHSPTK